MSEVELLQRITKLERAIERISAARNVSALSAGVANRVLKDNGSLIVAGQVDYTDMVANAVTQVVDGGIVPGSSTTSTSDVTLDTISITTVGGPILFFFCTPAFNNTASWQIVFSAQVDSGAIQTMTYHSQPASSGNYYVPFAGLALFTGVSAGSHSVKLLWRSPQASTITTPGNGLSIALELKR